MFKKLLDKLTGDGSVGATEEKTDKTRSNGSTNTGSSSRRDRKSQDTGPMSNPGVVGGIAGGPGGDGGSSPGGGPGGGSGC